MSILNLDALLENQLQTTGELNPSAPHTRLHFPTGQTVVIPTELLLSQATQSTPGAVAAEPAETASPAAAPVAAAERASTSEAAAPRKTGPGEAVIPLVQEQLEVSKREVETAKVRLRRETEEYVQDVSVPLAQVTWEVEHVPVNQVVVDRPEIRQVGEVTIFPLLEERLVVNRELFLREEVHVRKVTTVVEKSAQFPLKRDVLIESRTETTNN